MTTFSEMLEEMVVRILSRLPPKSLVRFKCVSKLWYTIINDPSFVAKNLSISKHNRFASATCILVKHSLPKDRSTMDEEKIAALSKTFQDHNTIDILLSLLHICNHDDDRLTYAVEDLGILFPSSVSPAILQIVGHCDGIICLSNEVNAVLCNPAIREFKLLPESCVLFDLPPADENEDEYNAPWSNTAAMGFGLDPKTKEYKIVRVVETTSSMQSHPTRAEVYTMGANSWRELKHVDLGCHVYWAPSFDMHFKGIFYWWAFAPDKELILTFDMSDEIFHPIPVPVYFDFDFDGRRYRSLGVLKDSIVLLTYESDQDVPKFFDIWMMDESTGDEKVSWTKYLTFGPVEGIHFSLVIWNSEELLMVDNDSRLVSYNLNTKTLQHFPIQDVQGARNMQAFIYVNSLISIKEERFFPPPR